MLGSSEIVSVPGVNKSKNWQRKLKIHINSSPVNHSNNMGVHDIEYQNYLPIVIGMLMESYTSIGRDELPLLLLTCVHEWPLP